MLHINEYPVWPDGRYKKQSGFGPLSGTLIEEYDATACFDPNDLTVVGNPWGVPNFLWIANNDTSGATIGPAGLNMAATGAGVVSGQPTPYQYTTGVDATAEEYDGVDYRADAAHPLVPLATDDFVCICKFRGCNDFTNASQVLCGTADMTGNGWTFNKITNSGKLFVSINNSGLSHRMSSACGAYHRRTWNLAIFILDRAVTRGYGFLNGIQDGNLFDGVYASRAYGGNGFAMGAGVSGASKTNAGVQIEWWAWYYGAGLSAIWRAGSDRLIKRLSMEAVGVRETLTNSKYWFFQQAASSAAFVTAGINSYKDHNDRWTFYALAPAAGNPNGCHMSGYSSNKAVSTSVFNFDPPNTTGWTVSGGVFSVVSDAAALITAKAEVWGPNVYSFANATGSSQTVYAPNAAAQVTSHFYVLGSYTAGSGAEMGWYDTAAATFTAVGTIAASYALTRVCDQTPASATCRYAIRVPDGATLLFIGHCLANFSSGTATDRVGRNQYPIPYNYGGSVYDNTNIYRCRDTLTTEYTISNTSGSFLTHVAPIGWGGTECATDNTLLVGATTAGDVIHAEKVAAGWATSDGTTQIQTAAPYVPVDGTYVYVWTAWKLALQYIQQGTAGVAVTGAYDGAKGAVGSLMEAPSGTQGGDYVVKKLQIRQV
jgi:hypothetical protein